METVSINNKFVFWRFKLSGGRRYLIPLISAKLALKGLEIYNPQSLRAKLSKQLFKLGFASNVLLPMLPKYSFDQGGDSATNRGIDRFLLQRLAAEFENEKVVFAISLGTPGVHRKPVIQIMNLQGTILGYAKIAGNEETKHLVENEADTLRMLSTLKVSSFRFPRLLYSGQWNNSAICIQSSTNGKSIPAPREMTPAYMAILRELAKVNLQSLNLDESHYWQEVLRRSERIQNPYYAHVVEQGILKINEWVGANQIYFHFRHGDFAPWNMKQINQQIFVFDWEYASKEAPAGWDLFHFWIQTKRFLDKWKPAKIYRACQQDTNIRFSLVDYLQTLNLDHQYIHSLLLLYLLDRLSFYAAEDPLNFSVLQPLVALTTLLIFRDQSA